MTFLAIRDPAHAPLLARFYAELYLPAFHHQREPLESWTRQLWDPARAPYDLAIHLAGDALDGAAARITGGVVSELYPRSGCGLVTYLVVAPDARNTGLGRGLLDHARRSLAERAAAAGIPLRAVFGEIADPAHSRDPEARSRLARFQRWGARVVDVAYIQPQLGPGLARDSALRLIAFFDGVPPATLPAAIVTNFLDEFFAATEGGARPATPASPGAIGLTTVEG